MFVIVKSKQEKKNHRINPVVMQLQTINIYEHFVTYAMFIYKKKRIQYEAFNNFLFKLFHFCMFLI